MQARMKLPLIILFVVLLTASVDARGGGRGGGGRGSSSRGSSSSSRGGSSSSRTSSSSSSSSYGWRSPSTTSTSTSSSSNGWRNPSTSTSSTSYGWRSPSSTTSSTYGWMTPSTSTNTAIGGYRNPSTWTSSTGSTWRNPSTSGLPTTTSGANRFLYGGGGSGTAMRLGALAGASRFRTRTRYHGGGFSFESNSIEDATVPTRTVVLSASQSGTCNEAITRRNATRPSTTMNVTIYEHENLSGKKEAVELPPRQCVNVHMIDPTWNDKASSIDPGDACVMIWEHRDCTGRFACFRKGTRGVNSLRLVGLNDELTSLQLC